MPVGAFLRDKRRTIRAEVNPLDKSTIVSIFPKEIIERNPTIQPGRFHISAGSYEKPAILVVGPSSWWREIDDEQPLIEIPVSSIQIADSFVKDFCNGLLGCNMSDNMPGIFYIPGELKEIELKTKYKARLDAAQANQKRWFMTLVKLADTLWSRSNGNPLAINDMMRLACRELGIGSKEWLQDFQHVEMIRCVACGAMRNPDYPVCGACHAIIDAERAKALNLVFAQK
jgi:hypothetical protein